VLTWAGRVLPGVVGPGLLLWACCPSCSRRGAGSAWHCTTHDHPPAPADAWTHNTAEGRRETQGLHNTRHSVLITKRSTDRVCRPDVFVWTFRARTCGPRSRCLGWQTWTWTASWSWWSTPAAQAPQQAGTQLHTQVIKYHIDAKSSYRVTHFGAWARGWRHAVDLGIHACSPL
jgi:hypothetical protein